MTTGRINQVVRIRFNPFLLLFSLSSSSEKIEKDREIEKKKRDIVFFSILVVLTHTIPEK